MALNPNTQQLIEENKSQFQQEPQPVKYDFSGFKSVSRRDVGEAQPILTQEKYEDYSPYIQGQIDVVNQDVEEQRAQGQSGLELIGKALGQTATELTLGTLENVGYATDVPGMYHSLKGDEQEFDNWWSKIFRDAKESINEKWFPIYQSNAAKGGNYLTATSLAANFKNLASTATLMVPSIAAARGLNILGKIGEEARIANLVRKGLSVEAAIAKDAKMMNTISAIGAGLYSRHNENTMESQQFLAQNIDKYKQDLSPEYEKMALEEISKLPIVNPFNPEASANYTAEDRARDEQAIVAKYKTKLEDDAKEKAIKGANLTYKADGALVALDVLEYMPMFHGFGHLLGQWNGAGAVEKGLELAGEAFEEGHQSGVQLEAYQAIKNNTPFMGPGFSERFADYLKDSDLQSSMMWGALGAGVFTALGPVAKKISDVGQDFNINRARAASLGDVDTFTKLTNDKKEDLIYKHAKRNRLDKLTTDLDALSVGLDEQDWAEVGTTKEEAQSLIDGMKEDISFASAEKSKLDQDEKFIDRDEAKFDFLKTKLRAKNDAKLIKSIDESISSLYKEIADDGHLSPELLAIKKKQDKIDGLKSMKANLKQIPSFKSNEDLRAVVSNQADLGIALLNEQLKTLKNAYLEANPGIDINTALTTPLDQTIADKYSKLNELSAVHESVIKRRLKAYENSKSVAEIDQELKDYAARKRAEIVKENLNNSTTPEEIDGIAETLPEEDVEDADNHISKSAEEEAIDAPDAPDLRYVGRPNLFVSEMGQLEGHVLNDYEGNIDDATSNELSAIVLSANPEEFTKALTDLSNLAKTNPLHKKLYDSVIDFYSNINKFRSEPIINEPVGHSEPIIEEFTEPEIIEPEIVDFHPTTKNTSDIGYKPTGETISDNASPNRANIRQHTMTAGNVKKVNGIAEVDNVGKTMPINWEYVNDAKSLAIGSDIYFVVNLDVTSGKNKDAYHSKLKGDNFINSSQILIAQRDASGNEQIVNALPIHNPADTSEESLNLKRLRDEIWNSVKSSGQRTGMFNTGLVTKVTKKYAGRLLTTKGVNNPNTVLPQGQKLVFGIATNINGVTTINAGKNVDPEYSGIVVDSKNDGGVFILIRGANGKIIPARCFTQTLNKFPKLLAEAKQLLSDTNKNNWAANREELRKIVFFDYNYIAKTDSFELRGKNGNVTTFDKTNLDSILSKMIVQVSSSQINRGGYNQRISEEGRLKTDLNPGQNITNVNFEFSLDYYKEGERPIVRTEKKLESIPEEYDTDRISTDPIFGVPSEPVDNVIDLPTTEGFNDTSLDSLDDFENPLGDIRFRLTDNTPSNESFYDKLDSVKETEWFKERFDEKLINVEEFKNGLINIYNSGGKQAWGMFKNGVAYISGSAKTGTTYHEAFHVVFHLFLNDSQRASILKEGAKVFNLKEGQRISIEEAVADRFMDYVQTQDSRGLTQKILDFFKHLYYVIKSGFTTDLTINQLFDKIQSKGFKSPKFERNVDSFKVVRYSTPGFSAYEENRRAISLADFMRKALDKHISDNPELSTLSRRDVLSRMTAKSKSGKDLKGLDMLALSARASILNEFKSNPNTTPEQKANVAKMLNNFIKLDESGNVVFEAIGRKALNQFAHTEGLRIKLSTKEINSSVQSAEEAPLMELAEEETTSEGWQIKAENLSGKESLSNEVRKELSYIPKVDAKGNQMVDDLGFPIYQDFNTVYADLQRELANILDSEELIDRLEDIVSTKPYLSNLLDKVRTDDLFRTKMFVNFNRSHVDYTTVLEVVDRDTNKKTFKIFSSNRTSVRNILIDEWKDNSTDPTLNKTLNDNGSYKKEELDRVSKAWNAISGRMKSKSKYDNQELSDMSKVLNYIGVTISLEDLSKLNKDYTKSNGKVTIGKYRIDTIKQQLDKIINSLTTGKNPFYGSSTESEAINYISGTIAKNRSELMESSFKNAENETVYSHQVPTFLSRAISQFKGKNAEQKIAWYKETPFYRNSPWLNELEEPESRDNFEFVEIDAIKYDGAEKGVRYTSMTAKDFENTAINMFFNNGAKDYVYYKFPVVSDAPKMPFIKFRRYTAKECVDGLMNVYLQEKARIDQIKAREELRKTYVEQDLEIPDELKPIKNFDTDKSKRFLLLPFLNTGHARKAVESGNIAGVRQAILDWMNAEQKKDYDRLVGLGVFGYDEKGNTLHDSRIEERWGNANAFHVGYFYNSFLANTQMMSLFSGDPAFYKADKSAASIYSRTVDYQKRNKQNVSPKTTMDVNASYNLTEDQAITEGKQSLSISPTYNSIYIKDLEIPSNHAETIYNTLVDSGMEESQAAEIAGAYGHNSDSKINVTDAQAYITLPRYREIMIGLGRWNKDLQDAYPRLLNGTAKGEDLLLVMQPIKPFYFGHTKIGNLIMPSQNKNSEYLLLPQLVKQSKELSVIYDHMIKNNISSVNFNSAVKAGEFGATTWDNIANASVHVLNNEDYGLQQETPEHHVDSRSLFGSQIRKLILSDIAEDAVFNLAGTNFTKKELVDLYQNIISEDLKEDYEKVAERFSNPEAIEDLLQSEIADRDLGEEREKAAKLVERPNLITKAMEKVFNLPLFHPYHAKSNESLLNSVFKNNVTKQKIKGGAFVQVSSFGFTDELNLVMDGERLVGAEVMLPWWSHKYFKPLLDANGQLDINKVPQNLREMIGYRIPTEDKYSMLPLIVKGFLPASAGGAVMLPMEITTISGSDFDIDKMYIMMPEYEVSQDKQDIRKIEYNYSKESKTQSKQARNNAKIDVLRAILTNQDTFSKIVKPGGFPTLESLARKVLLAEGKADEMLPIALPSTQTELFKRNMTGKQLIGIFANHNTSHAVMQYTNLTFHSPISFDGISRSSLHEVYDIDNKFISRNVAEWLAAVVDNAKNPLSSFINVNTYTADVAATLTRLGFPLETVVGFLSQHILKQFSEEYFANGANKQAEAKTIAKLEKLLPKADNEFQLNTNELYDAIEKKTTFSPYQANVLSQFVRIKEQATALADLVRATRSDTKGAGPTLSENEKLIQLRKDVLLNQELVGVQDLFDGKVYPMESAFMQYGITKPTELLSKYFPWFSPAFKHIKDRIANSMKANTLTVKQIEQINYELLGYTATGFEFFNGKDKDQIINNMSKRVKEFKTKFPKIAEENFFINKLVFKKDERNPSFPERVQFRNTGSMNELDKQQVKEAWMELLESPKFSNFGKELVKYAFYTAGFQLTPNSFSHLIPVDFYSSLTDSNGLSFNDYLSNMIAEAESKYAFSGFEDQFFRNNYSDPAFVPMVDTDKFENITGKVNYMNGRPAWFTVNAKDKNLRRDFIVGVDFDGEIPIFTFAPFVSMQEKGVKYLFELQHEYGNPTATYILTNKLGIPNAALEYDKLNSHPTSAISQNNPFVGKLTKSAVMIAAGYTEIEELKSNDEKVVEPEVEAQDISIKSSTNKEVIPVKDKFTRNSVSQDAEYLYLFTDNARRTSGKNLIPPNSWYSKKYGSDNKYPGVTQAVIRGLPNAAPITTMVDDNRTQWSDNQFDQYKKIIDNEVDTIKRALTSDRFKGIKFASQMPFGQGQISDMRKSAPKIWNYMNEKLLEIGIDNTGVNPTSTVKTTPSDPYSEIVESLRSKLLNEIKNDDSLIEFFGTDIEAIKNMNVEELGELYKKFCNRF